MIDFQPKEWNELIGNGAAIDKVKRWLPNYNLLLHGSAGIGKNSTISVWAGKNGFDIFEINASDNRNVESLNFLKSRAKLNLFKPTLFLLDEADGMLWWRHGNTVWDIILGSVHPFVLIANDPYQIKKSHDIWKTKHSIKKDVIKEVRFYKPRIKTVVARLKTLEKKYNVKFNFTNVSTDIRASLNTLQTSADKYEPTQNVFEILRNLFTSGDVSHINLKEHAYWINENIPKIYHGYNLIYAYKVLNTAIKCNNPIPLNLLPRATFVRNIEYPSYLRRSTKARKRKPLANDIALS